MRGSVAHRPAGAQRGGSDERRSLMYNLKGQLLYSSRLEVAGLAPGAGNAQRPEDQPLTPHIQQLHARLKTLALTRSTHSRTHHRPAESVSIRVGPHTYRLRGLLLDSETALEPSVLIVLDRTRDAKQAQLDLDSLGRLYSLTKRETEVLAWVRRGASYKVMAQELGISPYTIRDHVLKMKLKFRADGKCGIMARLLEACCLV